MIYVVRPYAVLPSEGAANDRYVNLCLELRARGMNATLACSTFMHNKRVSRTAEEINFNRSVLPFVAELDSPAYRRNISWQRVMHELVFGLKALWLALRLKPRMVIVGEPLFFVGWIFVAYGMLVGVEVDADVIDIWPEADTRRPQGLKGACLKALYGLLRISRALRFRLYSSMTFVSESHAAMFPNSPTKGVFYWGSKVLPKAQERPSRANEPITVVYAGSLGEGYDVEAIVGAAELISAQLSRKCSIVIAGGGEKEGLVRAAAHKGHVRYLGYMSADELVELYMRADIGLLPYKAHSQVAMPIKFFDYVNFGLFMICSLTMEVADVISCNDLGCMYKAGDARDLYEKILAASEDRAMLRRAAARCEYLSGYYSVARQYGDFAEFVRSRAEA